MGFLLKKLNGFSGKVPGIISLISKYNERLMYIPSYFRQEDRYQLLTYMQQHPFGILVSSQDGGPLATHLPFVCETEGDRVVLYSHLSAANPQGALLAGRDTLVIFREAHAYISPSHYERQENVPTWNYVAVHAYGKPEIITERKALVQLQEKMITALEPAYLEQWRSLPENYLDGLFRGITGFRIPVERLYGKEKLSQNKTANEQHAIAGALSASADSAVKEIGERMQRRLAGS